MSHSTIAATSGIITSQDSNLIVITAFGTTNGNNSLEREFLELVWTGNVRAIREHLVRLQKQNQVSAVIDCKDDEGRYAIMKAAFQGFSEVVQLLIDFGASLTTKSKMGESILMFAVASGSLETVQVLLQHGADVHHMNKARHCQPPLATLT
jgi:ankyrin repeat protein